MRRAGSSSDPIRPVMSSSVRPSLAPGLMAISRWPCLSARHMLSPVGKAFLILISRVGMPRSWKFASSASPARSAPTAPINAALRPSLASPQIVLAAEPPGLAVSSMMTSSLSSRSREPTRRIRSRLRALTPITS
jgi:hypothetical protein